MLSSSEYDINQHSGTSGSKLRVTNFSYSVSSEEKGHRENMSLRLKWAPIFCVRRCRDIYGCVSTKKAKQLMTAKKHHWCNMHKIRVLLQLYHGCIRGKYGR